ncbi:hypothetical protein FRB99_001685 [Tulasnella sp. 403]|nr:hypothetical protein FRB99_001685 [Tulasnella sp. 403]
MRLLLFLTLFITSTPAVPISPGTPDDELGPHFPAELIQCSTVPWTALCDSTAYPWIVEWWREGYSPYRLTVDSPSWVVDLPVGGPYIMAVMGPNGTRTFMNRVVNTIGSTVRCSVVNLSRAVTNLRVQIQRNDFSSRDVQAVVTGGFPPYKIEALTDRGTLQHNDQTLRLRDIPEDAIVYLYIRDATDQVVISTIGSPSIPKGREGEYHMDPLRRRRVARADPSTTPTATTTDASTSTTSASASPSATKKPNIAKSVALWFAGLLPFSLIPLGIGLCVVGMVAFIIFALVSFLIKGLWNCIKRVKPTTPYLPYRTRSRTEGNPSSSGVHLPMPPPAVLPVAPVAPMGMVGVPPMMAMYTIPAGVASMSMADVGVGVAGPPPAGLAVLLPPRPASLADSAVGLPSPAAFKPGTFPAIAEPPPEEPDADPNSEDLPPPEVDQVDQQGDACLNDEDVKTCILKSTLDDGDTAPGPSSTLAPPTGDPTQIRSSTTPTTPVDSTTAPNTTSNQPADTGDTGDTVEH